MVKPLQSVLPWEGCDLHCVVFAFRYSRTNTAPYATTLTKQRSSARTREPLGQTLRRDSTKETHHHRQRPHLHRPSTSSSIPTLAVESFDAPPRSLPEAAEYKGRDPWLWNWVGALKAASMMSSLIRVAFWGVEMESVNQRLSIKRPLYLLLPRKQLK